MKPSSSRIQNKAFTLIELMVVMGSLMLLMLPAWEVFRRGTSASVKGMLQIETTLEARRILRQVTNDLKQSCWKWDDSSNGIYKVRDILKKTENGWTFLSFPLQGPIEDAIPRESTMGGAFLNKFPRRVSRISYRLEPVTGKYYFSVPLYKFIRSERFNPGHPLAARYPQGTNETVLSERVLQFRIDPYLIRSSGNPEGEQEFLWITLKLGDFGRPPDKQTAARTLQEVARPGPDVVIASFFDIVSPEFHSAYRQMAGPLLSDEGYYSRNTFTDPIPPEDQK